METNSAMTTERKFNTTLLVTRVSVSVIVLAHGVQKLFGWFNGYGFEGTMGFFTGTIGLPYIIALAVIVIESFGMLALALGLFGRFFAASLIIVMLGAIITVHGQYGFFMNWGGNLPGEGFEFHILVIALSAVTLINGSGAYSLDRLLFSGRPSASVTIA
jgi:putative oxidoreductase